MEYNLILPCRAVKGCDGGSCSSNYYFWFFHSLHILGLVEVDLKENLTIIKVEVS